MKVAKKLSNSSLTFSGCGALVVPALYTAGGGATVVGVHSAKKSGEKTTEAFYSLRVQADETTFLKLKKGQRQS